MISRIFNHVAPGEGASGSNPDLFGRERIAISRVTASSNETGRFSMTFRGPFVNGLSVVTAYVAFAFVGAIVLGVF